MTRFLSFLTCLGLCAAEGAAVWDRRGLRWVRGRRMEARYVWMVGEEVVVVKGFGVGRDG